MMPAVWTALAGLVLLVLLVPVLLGPLGRVRRARAALRRGLAPRVAALRELAQRRPGRGG